MQKQIDYKKEYNKVYHVLALICELLTNIKTDDMKTLGKIDKLAQSVLPQK